MSIINVENVSKKFGEKVILQDVSFGMEAGEKIGVIGINGTGKSTLLKIIAGQEETDQGNVIRRNNLKVAVLPQVPEFPKGKTLLSCITDSIEDMADGWNMEARAREMLTALELPDVETAEHLSGGELKKLALIQTLIQPSDILILDEPTNHLDLSMVAWLEKELLRYKGTILLVTHDRYFLDRITDRILEIDHGSVYSYLSNYSGFLLAKEARIEASVLAEHKRQQFIRTELEWVRRGAQARTTKQKARLQRFEEISSMTRLDINQDGKVEMQSIASRLGNKTVEISGVSKGFENRSLISNFTFTALRNDRIGIVGPNGCGKSTLLKLIAGVERPDTGSIQLGETVKVGYLTQNMDDINSQKPDTRVIDYVRDVAEYINTPDGKVTAAKMLERFLFEGPQQYTPLEKLSGGEKRRLRLLRVLMEAPNVLLLDEPTNDLDIATLAVFEDFISHFDGIVIAVSHDRYFLDNIADRILAFEAGGNLVFYPGNYTDYAKRVGKDPSGMLQTSSGSAGKVAGDIASGDKTDGAAADDLKAAKNDGRRHDDKPRFSYQEKREYETIEADIEALELKNEELDQSIAANASDFAKLSALSAEKEKVETELMEKMERWEYLSNLAERIDSYNQNK